MRSPALVAGLMYHEVTDDPTASGFQRPAARAYTHSPAAFGAQLDAIAATALRPSLATTVDLRQPGHHLFLTFDDGGRSALHVADALDRRGWKAHFFIVTERIGERTFLRGPDLRALRAAGHVVGSHSHTHPDIMSDLPRERLAAEWNLSRTVLEAHLGEACTAASVPGGDLSPAVAESAAAAGFRYLFTSEPTPRPERAGDLWLVGRVCLKRGASPETASDLVRFHGWHRARWERQLKGLARRGLAPVYRLYVRHVTRSA